ncbi:hypothetical protein Aduo_001887 [Ancylostoma duodenale]
MSFDNFDFAINNEVSGSFATVIDLLRKVDDKIEKLTAEVSQQGLAMATKVDDGSEGAADFVVNGEVKIVERHGWGRRQI